MFKRNVHGRFGTSVALPALVLALIGASVATPAEARHHHHGHAGHHGSHHGHFRAHARHSGGHHHAAAAGVGATAAIVVDGATGRVIYGMNENAPRHPASVTKVMTLYLLFEQLEKGRFTLDSEIPVSAHAAAQAPSKLGLRPGQTIRVEDAIKVIVTKSANDIAVAVAEAVADGTEGQFAELMTQKAHALGMTHTLYRNASGLPNDEQITTAADLAVLGRNIQERFPRYYRYFSLHEVAYHGQRIHNHNHLMERVEGMDGIKTGYTAASGFNLLTSVKRNGHYIVSVVMGGKSARSRDNYMESLIEEHIDEGGARGATRVAEQEESGPARWFQAQRAEDERQASRAEPASRAEEERQAKAEPVPAPPAKAEGEKKIVQKTPSERVAAVENAPLLPIAAVMPEPRPRPAYVSAAAQANHEQVNREQQSSRDNEDFRAATASIPRRPAMADGSTAKQTLNKVGATTPSSLRWTQGPSAKQALRAATRFEPAAPGETKGPTKVKAEAKVEARTLAKAEEESVSAQAKQMATKPPVPGWVIQIGATDDADKAAVLLSRAKSQQSAKLGAARPYTEIVHKGRETLYRARFAGLEESKAEAACKALITSGFNCFATKN
jgi:D-alanyl-D-alanine carboxypeptidase